MPTKKPNYKRITTERVLNGEVSLTGTQVKQRIARVAELLDQINLSMDKDRKLARDFYFALADVRKFAKHDVTCKQVDAISRV